MKIKQPFSLLLAVALALIDLTGCSKAGEMLTVFQPDENSLFKITFSHPANWTWIGLSALTKRQIGNSYDAIHALDPYTSGGTRAGRIDITVVPSSDPDVEMQENYEQMVITRERKLRDNKLVFDAIGEQTLAIDGQEVKWFLYKTPPFYNAGEAQSYLWEDIFFAGADRYYRIQISYPEEEVSGQFPKECEALIRSIKFLP